MVPRPRTRRIAIADGSPEFLAAAAQFIRTLPGFVLAGTASSCEQALALVEAVRPDIVLVDLALPAEGALALTRRLKADGADPAVAILALFHTPEIVAAARAAGSDAVIAKEEFARGLSETLQQLFSC